MTIADADYWMVKRDSERCVLLSHDRGLIVASREDEAETDIDGETWHLLVRLDGDEIHDDFHEVTDKSDLWEIIEDFGERFEGEE